MACGISRLTISWNVEATVAFVATIFASWVLPGAL
jgi:hypothetical protein